jgi:hypothetical protein
MRSWTVRDVAREQQECDADDSKGDRLARMAALLEAPQQRDPGQVLDHGVDPESDQGRASGDDPGGDRDHRFQRVPPQREPLEAPALLEKPPPGRERKGLDGFHLVSCEW